MKWKLRWARPVQRDIWRPTELLAAFEKVGFEPSLSKVSACGAASRCRSGSTTWTRSAPRSAARSRTCWSRAAGDGRARATARQPRGRREDERAAGERPGRAAGRRAAVTAAELGPWRTARPRTGQCRGCLGWGMLTQPPYCSPCHQWRSKKYSPAWDLPPLRMPRLVNADGLCRGCIVAVTESDADLVLRPRRPRPPVQLELIIPGLPRRPAKPIGSYRLRSDGRYHPPPWARRQRPETVFNDQRVCPPVMPGQLKLWRASRSIAWEHATRIRDRPLAG